MFSPLRIHFGRRRRINNGPLGCLSVIVFIVIFVVLFIWISKNGIEHVEDMNGPEDISIAMITDMDIVNMNYGSKGSVKTESMFNVKFSSKKFTGVEELFYNNYISDNNSVTLRFSEYTVTEGNFALVVVNEGEILAKIEPGDSLEYTFENISGRFSVRIVGESAAYTIRMDNYDYDQFFHP